MTILNWALWGLLVASVAGMIISGGVTAVDKTICSRHDRATTVLMASAIVGTLAAGIGVVIA